jgi:hypothetical protein
MVAAAKPVLWQIMNDYWKACQETEAVLFPTLAALPAASIAEKLQTPAYRAYLQHVHPTRVYPGPLAMSLQHLGDFYNELTYPSADLFSGNSCGPSSTGGERKF